MALEAVVQVGYFHRILHIGYNSIEFHVMTPLTFTEIENLAQELKTFEGVRLQDVQLSDQILALRFGGGADRWVVFDLQPQAPQVVVLQSLSGLGLRAEKKPVALFIKAHLLDHRLVNVETSSEFGRVIKLNFSDSTLDGGSSLLSEMEVRLFPRGANVIVKTSGKEVALYKPQPLKGSLSPSESSGDDPTLASASLLSEKTALWLEERCRHVRSGAEGENQKCAEKQRLQKEKKILKAIEKIDEDLRKKQDHHWAAAGEWLKMNQTLDVPPEYEDYIDAQGSLAENLERCFSRAKELKNKLAGTRARRSELVKELEHVRSGEWAPPARKNSLIKMAEARGRTFELGPEVMFFVGKSAEDNLRLLREAKPWHLWFHLSESPGAHGILQRQKQKIISDRMLHQVAHHLLKTIYGERAERHQGEKFEVLVAECRYVRPIKGERKGRVTYTNARTFVHQFSP